MSINGKVKVSKGTIAIKVFTDLLARLDAVLVRHIDVKDDHAKVMHWLR